MSAVPGELISLREAGREAVLRIGDPEEHIQRTILTTGSFYELEMLRDVWSRHRPGESIIDVGANLGNHTVFFSVIIGARVHAFEPDPGNFAALAANVAANPTGAPVSLSCIAVGRSRARGRLIAPHPENGGQVRVELTEGGEVEVQPLDGQACASERIGTLKIDVEGMELDVIEGASALIDAHHPLVYVEASTGDEFAAIEATLSRRGYVAWKRFNCTPTYLFIHASRFPRP